MGGKHGGGQGKHTADQDVCRGWHKHGGSPARPPVEDGSENGHVIDHGMGDGDFGFARAEAVALDQRHEFGCARHDGGNGEEDGEDGGVVGEEREELWAQLDVQNLVWQIELLACGIVCGAGPRLAQGVLQIEAAVADVGP